MKADMLMCWCVVIASMCWCVMRWCVDVLMCWCVDVVDVLTCWCVDVLMCWCVDVLMCWCVDVLMCWCVDVVMCWCVDVLTCWCVDVLMCWRVNVLMLMYLLCNEKSCWSNVRERAQDAMKKQAASIRQCRISWQSTQECYALLLLLCGVPFFPLESLMSIKHSEQRKLIF